MTCVSMADDAVYCAHRKRIYIAGSGAVSVFQQQDPDHYKLVSNVPGSYCAKTAILAHQLNRYYLAVPHHGAQGAEVRVYEVTPQACPPGVRGPAPALIQFSRDDTRYQVTFSASWISRAGVCVEVIKPAPETDLPF